jgi:hypothetical protein
MSLESQALERVLPVRVVLGEVVVSPDKERSCQGLRLSENFEGLVQLRLGAETIALGQLCLHGGQLAVRVSRVADSLARIPTGSAARTLESEGA